MTDGEFEALARVAAGMLDAPIATISRLAARVTRLGGSGVSWPPTDEEPFLRWAVCGDAIARPPAVPPVVIELEPEQPGAELLAADGIVAACLVPLRDTAETSGVLAIYTRTRPIVSHAVRRGLIDLGEIASSLLAARNRAELRGDWPAPRLSAGDDSVAALGVHEQRILAHLEHSPDGTVIADDTGHILYANPAAGHAFGEPASELIGRSLAEFNPPELHGLPGFARYRATGTDTALGKTYAREIQLGNGARRTMEISAAGFTIDEVRYVGFTLRDPAPAQQRLEATLASAPVAIAHVALDGQFLRFNDELVRLVGRPATELRAYRQTSDIAPPPDARGLSFTDAMDLVGRLDLAAVRSQLVTTPGAYQLEYQLTRPDGSAAWVDLSIAIARDGERPAFFVAVGHDVTARKRAVLALRGLAETLSISAPELYARACAFLGTTLDATYVLLGRVQGAMVVSIAAWHDGAEVEAPSYPLVGTPCETVRRSGICYYPERLQQLFPEDHMLADIGATSYLGAPLRDEDGEVIGLIAVLGKRAFDPALSGEELVQLCATRFASALQRLDATRELETREEQLRQITESAHETFWLKEWPSQRLIYVSPAFADLTGRTVASVYADRETWGSGLHPDDRPMVDAAMRGLDRAPVDLSARVIRADGQLRWIQIRASLIRDRNGEPYRVAGSFEDMTQIKEVQHALEERERQLGEALASSEREVEQLQQRLGEGDQLRGMIGSSQAMRMVYRRLRQAAQSDVTVLIGGESGTGKELAAKALHELSPRAARPFVAINCSAIPEPLLESELFGHVKGAFTGASRDKVGLMQSAEAGTLFLDEIGDMSQVLQVKLLRALQERQIRRIGDDKPISIDVRLVSASHRDLRALVASGRMREDFYYRIKVFEIEMPSLRDRREDIPALANYFSTELGRAAGKPNLLLSAEALRALLQHRWPGNVRELRNAIEHALVTVTGQAIQLADLPVELRSMVSERPLEPVGPSASAAVPPPGATIPMAGNPREQIEDALRRSGGNRAEAARLLGIGRVTLWKRMRRLGMPTTGEAAPSDET
ncbi:MAG TPA: sigma 54-interacting transcriptional regulator [Kofleriaceae bacterium]